MLNPIGPWTLRQLPQLSKCGLSAVLCGARQHLSALLVAHGDTSGSERQPSCRQSARLIRTSAKVVTISRCGASGPHYTAHPTPSNPQDLLSGRYSSHSGCSSSCPCRSSDCQSSRASSSASVLQPRTAAPHTFRQHLHPDHHQPSHHYRNQPLLPWSSPSRSITTTGPSLSAGLTPTSAPTSGSNSASTSSTPSNAQTGAPGAGAGDDTSTTGGGSGSSGTARGPSVDPREAAKFAALAASWWRTTDGPFAPLHALNPARVLFVRQSLAAAMGLDAEAPEPLAGLRVLDVGCGGGILSESLARLGASVHGIDVTRENVEAARVHARMDPLVAARVRYDVISAEDLAASGTAKYDVVVASEVLEHVSKPHQLLPVLTSLMADWQLEVQAGGQEPAEQQEESERQGGSPGETGREQAEPGAEGQGTDDGGMWTRPASSALIVSTLNRTPAAWALAIAAAEYLVRAVPAGTHQWHKFITPEELAIMAAASGLQVWHAAGLAPVGPRMAFRLTSDLSVNYIATLLRRHDGPQNSLPPPPPPPL